MQSLAWAVMPPAKSNTIATEITHPSTAYPWFRVAQTTGAQMRWVKADSKLRIDPLELISKFDDDTSVVCSSHVEYGTGQTYDLKAIADAAHRHGAICVVDGELNRLVRFQSTYWKAESMQSLADIKRPDIVAVLDNIMA